VIIDTKDIRVAIQQVSEGIPTVIDILVQAVSASKNSILGPWTPLLWLAGADVTGKLIESLFVTACRSDMLVLLAVIDDLGTLSKDKYDIIRMTNRSL
jgi:hypothetical protein